MKKSSEHGLQRGDLVRYLDREFRYPMTGRVIDPFWDRCGVAREKFGGTIGVGRFLWIARVLDGAAVLVDRVEDRVERLGEALRQAQGAELGEEKAEGGSQNHPIPDGADDKDRWLVMPSQMAAVFKRNAESGESERVENGEDSMDDDQTRKATGPWWVVRLVPRRIGPLVELVELWPRRRKRWGAGYWRSAWLWGVVKMAGWFAAGVAVGMWLK
jgi:hypothetical protein